MRHLAIPFVVATAACQAVTGSFAVGAGGTDSGATNDGGTGNVDADGDGHQGFNFPDSGGEQDASTSPETSVGEASPQEAAVEAAVEAAPPPECTAPRCVDGMTLQSCDDGTWGTFATCSYVCLDNACSGVCTPNATSCSSDTQLQTCNSSGQWVNSTCPNACVGSSCSGVCVPGTTMGCGPNDCADGCIQTCDANGTWDGGICQF